MTILRVPDWLCLKVLILNVILAVFYYLVFNINDSCCSSFTEGAHYTC